MTQFAQKPPNTDPKYWDERYEKEAFAYGQAPNAFLQAHIKSPPRKGAKALCLADGEGRNGVYLAQLGYQVTSLDFSPAAKVKALFLADQTSVSLDYQLTDLNEYQLQDNHWDLIASIFYQPIVGVRKRHYQKLFAALKPQGLFVLETKSSAESKDQDRYPGVLTLIDEIYPLEILFEDESVRELNEGDYHKGLQRTSQILARKS